MVSIRQSINTHVYHKSYLNSHISVKHLQKHTTSSIGVTVCDSIHIFWKTFIDDLMNLK